MAAGPSAAGFAYFAGVKAVGYTVASVVLKRDGAIIVRKLSMTSRVELPAEPEATQPHTRSFDSVAEVTS